MTGTVNYTAQNAVMVSKRSGRFGMSDFRKLAETLADRLNDANIILAYLSEKNIIDDEETIMKTWEILADAYNDIHEPEPEND